MTFSVIGTSVLTICFLITTSSSMNCYVGKHNETQLTPGFDYCVTIADMATKLLRYDGRNGPTKVFQKAPHDLSLGDCFIDIERGTSDVSCYCKCSACNPKITMHDFLTMMFSSRPN